MDIRYVHTCRYYNHVAPSFQGRCPWLCCFAPSGLCRGLGVRSPRPFRASRRRQNQLRRTSVRRRRATILQALKGRHNPGIARHLFRPFRALSWFGRSFQGRCPWLCYFAPSGLCRGLGVRSPRPFRASRRRQNQLRRTSVRRRRATILQALKGRHNPLRGPPQVGYFAPSFQGRCPWLCYFAPSGLFLWLGICCYNHSAPSMLQSFLPFRAAFARRALGL